MYQTQGEDYASITLRSVPDQTDLTPSDLPAREALELEQVKFSKEFKDRFRPKQGLGGLTEYEPPSPLLCLGSRAVRWCFGLTQQTAAHACACACACSCVVGAFACVDTPVKTARWCRQPARKFRVQIHRSTLKSWYASLHAKSCARQTGRCPGLRTCAVFCSPRLLACLVDGLMGGRMDGMD